MLVKNEKEKQEKATEPLNQLYDLLDEGDVISIGDIILKKSKKYIEFFDEIDDFYDEVSRSPSYNKPNKCS